MKTYVDISMEILRWVLTHGHIDKLSQDNIDLFNSWITGEKKPTFNQVEKISKATGIPLGYFFLQVPPIEDISLVQYRTIDSVALDNPSRNLIDTLHDMDQVQEWVHNTLVSRGGAPLKFVGNLRNQNDPDKAAQEIRDLLGLEVDWFSNSRVADDSFARMRNAISSIGTIVMMSGIVENNTRRPLDINEFRAFCVVDNYAPLVFINSNDSINGKLFSLIHEFVHICIGKDSLFNDRYSTGSKVSKTETLCNAVAAEILVPHLIFVREWNNVVGSESTDVAIDSLARFFKCGITVVARRAYDKGLIDYNHYQKIAKKAVQLYNDARKKKKENGDGGGNYYLTAASRIDNRFFNMLVSSVAEGKTLYSDAFRLTNTNRSTFFTLVDSIRGGVK